MPKVSLKTHILTELDYRLAYDLKKMRQTFWSILVVRVSFKSKKIFGMCNTKIPQKAYQPEAKEIWKILNEYIKTTF